MIRLDRDADVYRLTASGSGGYGTTVIYPRIRCSIVPISREDTQMPYALESTHVLWVVREISLRKEDEVRSGRRYSEATGTVSRQTYVVRGRARYHLGVPHTAYFVSEQE